MLKPVTILALDDSSAPLAEAVQRRIAEQWEVDDLAQWRAVVASADVTPALQSIHAQRQRPDSRLRMRDDVSARELVLLVFAAAGPARMTAIAVAEQVRGIYEMRRYAPAFTIELVCLFPDVVGSPTESDYAAAYGLLKGLSGAERKPFDEVWLLDATNSKRVRFGSLGTSCDMYADAIAGAVTLEPEMSGAIPGRHPRGMHPTFSSFGYAQLVFPREAAQARLEPRFASELVREKLLSGDAPVHAALVAKQFVTGDEFAVPLSRIGIDAGQSLFRRFQPKTFASDETRNADELIAAVRGELQTFRDRTHLQNLEQLSRQREETAGELIVLLTRVVDETLDREGYAAAAAMLDALIDPLPDLRTDVDVAPRNVATELQTATAALDARLRFTPNHAASSAARKRIRELSTLIHDQQLVADSFAPATASQQIAELECERAALRRRVPEMLFDEEAENNAARAAARDAEAERLGNETLAREEELRDLFGRRPRAEQALREALEMRRAWISRQILWGVLGLAAIFAVPLFFDALWPNLRRVGTTALYAAIGYTIVCLFRYASTVAPVVRGVRETLARIRAQIESTDRAKNAAHNNELQLEYDIAHRRAAVSVLSRVRDAAKSMLDALRTRIADLEQFASAWAPPSIQTSGLAISIVDDADVDEWYGRTEEDRRPFVREFPMTRSESRQLTLDELRHRVASYSATAFSGLHKMTIHDAAREIASQATLAQTLKRFAETCAPLVEVRDDDLPAQEAMQRDVTLWIDADDAEWIAQFRRRLPEAHLRSASGMLAVHAISRVLHYPAYVFGQIDYYRLQYESAAQRDFDDAPDVMPADLILTGAVRAAYEQVLLGRAFGLIELLEDGQLVSPAGALGDSHLVAAQRLASRDAGVMRDVIDGALAPRLAVISEVERDLRNLLGTPALSSLDRNVLVALARRYAPDV